MSRRPPKPKKAKEPTGLSISDEHIEKRIYFIRGLKVILDSDIAELYGVETRALVQAVKRNRDRFPEDFMLQMTAEELRLWRSQIVISNPSAKMALRRPPYAFTEQGVAMLSSVLRTDRAVKVNIAIMRAFVRLRDLLAVHKDLARRIDALEKKHSESDSSIRVLFRTVREYLEAVPKKTRRIGFRSGY